MTALRTLCALVLAGAAAGRVAGAESADLFGSPARFSYAAASAALAHHGPGTSGGGSSTASGETLRQGTWELELREDYTAFKKFSRPWNSSCRQLKSLQSSPVSGMSQCQNDP